MAPASALRAARCSACSCAALRLVPAISANARLPALNAIARPLNTAQAPRFSTFRPTPCLLSGPALEERLDDKHKDQKATTSDGEVPWYLQVEAPRHPTLLQKPVPLPEIPEGSPRLMEPLLKYVSDELGMDDLELLDLRELDPPAALGPRLIMLFGTARSERHLHVSADRLVRWLRGKGVSASADGLLGRNQLKVRLRRAARKAKLLGSSGVGANVDDGIGTGWICVHLGAVEGSNEEIQFLDEQGRPTGFGVPDTGTTIVVQLMTEAKREELDLEGLWKDTLDKSLRKNKGLPVSEKPQEITILPPDRSSSVRSERHLDPAGSRYFSTWTRRLNINLSLDFSDNPLSSVVLGECQESSAAQAAHMLHQDTKSKLYVLTQLRSYLKRLSKDEVDAILVKHPKVAPSPFLQLYDRAMENLAPVLAWEHRMWLWNTARSRDLPGYDLGVAKNWLREILLSSPVMTRGIALHLIQSVFAVPASTDVVARDQAALVMEVIDSMFARGQKVLDHDVLVTVIEALVRHPSPSSEAARILAQFEDLLVQADLPCPSEDLIIRLMYAYADQGRWERFWDVWRIPPRYCQGRSWRLYAHAYRIFAKDAHRARCIDALRRLYYEMKHEEPPVPINDSIRKNLKDCIDIADPAASEIARQCTERRLKIVKDREFVAMLLENDLV